MPAAMVASIHGKLRACVQAVEPALFGAANRLWVAAAVHLDSGEGQRLEPGHGVRLPDGEVAQVLAIVASPDQSRLFVFVQIFVAAGSNRKHPELKMPWLQRGNKTILVPASSCSGMRREHLVPLFGEAHKPRQAGAEQYIWNKGIFHAKADRAGKHLVFCSCPVTAGCTGRAQMPPCVGEMVTCPVCAGEFRWL